MVQQFGKILGQGFQKAISYVNTPANKKQVVRMMQWYFMTHHTEIEQQVGTAIKQSWISITSIRIIISHREKEVKFVTQNLEYYSVGNVEGSNVLLGKNIKLNINNYALNFHLHGNETHIIEELKTIFKNINRESSRLDDSSSELEKRDRLDTIGKVKKIDDEIKEIESNVYLHGEKIQKAISRITNYSQLQRALGTTT